MGHYLYLVIIGLIVGALARFLLPGKQHMGLIMTAILGVAGSLLANKVGEAIGWYKPGHTAGFIASIIGALILLVVYGLIKGKAIGEDFDNPSTDANRLNDNSQS